MNILELEVVVVVVVVVARGTHRATCMRMTAKRGWSGEVGHVYMNTKMNIPLSFEPARV